MNAALLQERLVGQSEQLVLLIESLGYSNVTYNPLRNTIRFSREEGTNPSSCCVNTDTLRYYCFSTNEKGNVFTLVMNRLKCSFSKALSYVANLLNIDKSSVSMRVRPPFGGFYKSLIGDSHDEVSLPEYSEDELQPYAGYYNMMFFNDGISFEVQEKFGVGYDYFTHRITIPQRSFDGKLVGIMGRSIDKDCPHEERWLPILRCSRSMTLFGYSENYKSIVEERRVIQFESEKAVMQCCSFGENTALALCGCHISKTQARFIKALRPHEIILALDEGLDEAAVREECKKLLSDNHILKTKVGYIFDHQNDVIPEYSKMNIADLGKSVYDEALKRKVVWLDGTT